MNIITRDIIPENFKFHTPDAVYGKSQIVDMIRFWKIILWEKYGARPGKSIGIYMGDTGLTYTSLVFAVAELGLTAIVLDSAVAEETLHKTKAAMFSPIDIGVYAAINYGTISLNYKMIQTYCKQVMLEKEYHTYKIVDDNLYSEIADKFFCDEETVFIMASTSGTTSDSKPVPYTHRQSYLLSKRNTRSFNHHKDERALHLKTMHHASSALIFFFPTIMTIENHYTLPTPNLGIDVGANDLVQCVVNNKINRILIAHQLALDQLFDALSKIDYVFDYYFEIVITGVLLTNTHLEKAKKHNLTIMNLFGSNDSAMPGFVNKIDSSVSTITPGYVGIKFDDYYGMQCTEFGVELTCPEQWAGVRILNDILEQRGDQFFYIRRDSVVAMDSYEFNIGELDSCLTAYLNNSNISIIVDKENNTLYLVLWDTEQRIILGELADFLCRSEFKQCKFSKVAYLSKRMFTVDTKVSMDQLRGYLQNIDCAADDIS